MGDGGLFSQAEPIPVSRAEEFVQARVASRKLTPVGQDHERLFALRVRAQVEEAREQAESPRRLPAPDFAVAVSDGKAAVASEAARLDLDLLEAFAQKRLEG